MRKLVLFLMFAIFANLCVSPVIASPQNAFKGIWEYKAPQAPYQYASGKIIFSELEGKPTVVIKFTDGTEVKGTDVKIEKDTFSFSTEIQYNLVKVTGKLVEGKITGKADSSEGLFDLSAVRKS